MKDYKIEVEIEGKKYSMVFNLNVMQDIQKKYGTIQKWGDLLERKNQEPDIESLIFGFGLMINEGIDINNEENNLEEKLLTEKQVGRLITKMGVANATSKLKNAVVEGTKEDKPKNE